MQSRHRPTHWKKTEPPQRELLSQTSAPRKCCDEGTHHNVALTLCLGFHRRSESERCSALGSIGRLAAAQTKIVQTKLTVDAPWTLATPPPFWHLFQWPHIAMPAALGRAESCKPDVFTTRLRRCPGRQAGRARILCLCCRSPRRQGHVQMGVVRCDQNRVHRASLGVCGPTSASS